LLECEGIAPGVGDDAVDVTSDTGGKAGVEGVAEGVRDAVTVFFITVEVTTVTSDDAVQAINSTRTPKAIG